MLTIGIITLQNIMNLAATTQLPHYLHPPHNQVQLVELATGRLDAHLSTSERGKSVPPLLVPQIGSRHLLISSILYTPFALPHNYLFRACGKVAAGLKNIYFQGAACE